MQDNDQRKNLNFNIWTAIIFAGLAVSVLVFTDFGKGTTVVYDCRDAHWHPDIPIDVKKECSRLMYEEWKRQQNEKENDRRLHENSKNLLRT